MKIKVKLTLGIGLLLLLIAVFGVVSVLRIGELADATRNILLANYNSVEYSRQMLRALDELDTEPMAVSKFSENLERQKKNVTEPGERELTENVAAHFAQLQTALHKSELLQKIRGDLNAIMAINMNAIERKSNVAETTSRNTIGWVSLAGALSFIVAFALLLSLPGSIANPIKELTASIKQIAARNYSQRVHFENHNEFGELARSFNTMAEKLEEYNSSNLAHIMMEKKRIETLINNMRDPVIGLDEHKKVLFANQEALRITGLTPETTIGRPVAELAINNDLIRYLLQDFEDERETSVSAPLKIYANGKESYFEKEVFNIVITPTGETTKKHVGHVITLRNVTSYKELDFAKTNFIATVSHELKTPISSIKMSLQLLEGGQAGQVSDEQKLLLGSIKDDANRLLKITGELLNMTQVESGKIQLNLLPVDPVRIMNQAVSACRTEAEQKNIRMASEISESLPRVMADEEKTTWVIKNLLSNAIRYSHEFSVVKVEVKTEAGKIRFSVKDTGQGIAPEYRDKIFGRYFRVPGTQQEGTGLGLSISKEFIEAQGGSITFESDLGAGSVFSVYLNTVNS